MNAPLHPEIFNRLESTPQADLPLAADGVLRYVWEGRFGPMLIEVRERQAFVNGQAVEPADGIVAATTAPPRSACTPAG